VAGKAASETAQITRDKVNNMLLLKKGEAEALGVR